MTDLSTVIGSVKLKAPLLTAAGTVGYGAEFARYLRPAELGAIVVKSMKASAVAGNPAPRVHPTPAGMINSVGLQGKGVHHWLAHELPALEATGAAVVASIWGNSIEEFQQVAEALAAAPACVIAVEVNVSCPNHQDRNHMFAHNAQATHAAIKASAKCKRPLWAKLSPNVANITEIAAAAESAGAQAVVLTNTLLAMVIDPKTLRPVLGAKGGGLSGAAMRPVAVRAVFDVHEALPQLPIIGVGGVSKGVDVVEFLAAGACAVEVGTATFADPRAPRRILNEFQRWCKSHKVGRASDLVGVAHK